MNRYILLSFLFMGWTFYVLSGGSDFVPPSANRIADANATPEPQAQPESAIANVSQPAPVLKPETINTATTSAKLERSTTPEPEVLGVASIEDAVPTTTIPDVSQPETTGIVMPAGWATDFQEQSVGADTIFSLASLEQIPVADSQGPVRGNRTVKGSAVNVRSGPGTDHSIVSRLTGGTEVQVISDPGEGWVEMRHVGTDTVGWMAASLLTP